MGFLGKVLKEKKMKVETPHLCPPRRKNASDAQITGKERDPYCSTQKRSSEAEDQRQINGKCRTSASRQ
jgi:hypothetical protein